MKGPHRPVQGKLHRKWNGLRKQLEVARNKTAKMRAVLHRGEQQSEEERWKRPEWRPTDRKRQLDALNIKRRDDIAKRVEWETTLRGRIAAAREAWERVPKMQTERDDGEPAAARVYMEMVFGYLWDPLLLTSLRDAVRFQRCCMDWRLAARSYVAHRPVFHSRIERIRWPGAHLLAGPTAEHGRTTMRVEFGSDAPVEIHNVMIGGPPIFVDAHALVPLVDDPTGWGVLIQTDGRNGTLTTIRCAGGKWKYNAAGDVRDWAQLPFGVIEARNPKETPVSWIMSDVKSKAGTIVSTNVVPGAKGSIKVALDVAEAKLVVVDAY
jgi:hypothetical protein